MKGTPFLAGCRFRVVMLASVVAGACLMSAASVLAAPGPEVEYVYNVMARRHFDFPDNDALAYGFGICAKVAQGTSYSNLVLDVQRDVLPNDEQSANYVVSYAVGLLCPAELWQLRNSAANHGAPR